MKGPLFLARRSYRRRRMRDAARVLPFIAAVLMIAPILWGQGIIRGGVSGDLATDTAVRAGSVTVAPMRALGNDAIYLFALWAALVVVAFVLSRGLQDVPDDPAGAPGDGR